MCWAVSNRMGPTPTWLSERPSDDEIWIDGTGRSPPTWSTGRLGCAGLATTLWTGFWNMAWNPLSALYFGWVPTSFTGRVFQPAPRWMPQFRWPPAGTGTIARSVGPVRDPLRPHGCGLLLPEGLGSEGMAVFSYQAG